MDNDIKTTEKILHELWGKSKDGVYDKKLWQEFQSRITKLEARNKELELSLTTMIERFKDRAWFKSDTFAISQSEQALNKK